MVLFLVVFFLVVMRFLVVPVSLTGVRMAAAASWSTLAELSASGGPWRVGSFLPPFFTVSRPPSAFAGLKARNGEERGRAHCR